MPHGAPTRFFLFNFKPLLTLRKHHTLFGLSFQASWYEYSRRPPRFSRPSQRVPLGLLQVPLATLSQPATQTLNQPVQRSCPPGLPTVRVPNPPVRPFRARGTVRHPAASDAIGTRHPHAQALAGAPSGPERASLRVSRPLQGAPRRPLASCLAPAVAAVAAR